ncbi:hypothetical protein U9M48_038104 [Paspalum notatum var. saurae]|uniref:Integrase catalytic domain-containing protein n=1 Tax=Paspalum notatum var. saurae TaxID=547442 RepID=A0AAQ3XBB7_PASNO
MSIDEYYSAFDRMMGALTSMVPECTVDPCPTHQFIEKFLTYIFYMDVRAEFDSLRMRLLQSSSTLTMSQALSNLLAEETRLKSMSIASGFSTSSVLMASQRYGTHKASSSEPCKHCGKTNHTSENCFSQHLEKLADFRARRAARAARSNSIGSQSRGSGSNGTGSQSRGSVSIAVASLATTSSPSWVLDSGASFHVTSDQSQLASCKPVMDGVSVQTADGTSCSITHQGSLCDSRFSVPNVSFVPQLSMNLLSVKQVTDLNCFGFDDSSCFVQDRQSGAMIGSGRCHKGSPSLYVLDTLRLPSPTMSPSHVSSTTLVSASSFAQWHHRLGHLCGSHLSNLIKSRYLSHTSVESNFNCKGCKLGKQIQLPYSSSVSHSARPFDLVHFDVWGRVLLLLFPRVVINIMSFLLMIILSFVHMVQTQFSTPIKVFHSDSGGEYLSDTFSTFLASKGTLAQLACPSAHAQNGVVERKHRHLIETAHTLLISSFVPSHFGGETVSTAVYLINRQPSFKLSSKCPSEVLFGTPPRYDHLHVFGCTCYVLLAPRERTKLTAQSVPRCYDPSSRRIRISRDVTFVENCPFFYNSSTHSSYSPIESTSFMCLPSFSSTGVTPSVLTPSTTSTSPPSIPVISIPVPPPSPPTPVPPTHSFSKPSVTQVYIYRPSSTTLANPDASPVGQRYNLRDLTVFGYPCVNVVVDEPSTYQEASSILEWQFAISEELVALDRTGTWDLVPLPSQVVPITSKWVFKIKTKSDGSIERYKARLAQGRDYDETFAPVAHMTIVRTLIVVAASSSWTILDVKNAFLHGDLHDEVYMQPPPGVHGPSGYVCRLRKALYGLKQAPPVGFSPSDHDPNLFIHLFPRGHTLLLLYVNDMLITGDDPDHISRVKQQLSEQFQMSDLGPLSYFLGIEVLQSAKGSYLSQSKYIKDLVARSGLSDRRTSVTHMDLHLKLSLSDGLPLEDPSRYRHVVGSLVYLTVTRPDIAHAVHILSQVVSAHTSVHYGHLLFVLRYLQGTSSQCLFYARDSPLHLHAYLDSDLGDPRRWQLYLDLVDRQNFVLLPPLYQKLYADFGISCDGPTPLHCDNTGAIWIAHDPVKHELTKHIGVDASFTRLTVIRRQLIYNMCPQNCRWKISSQRHRLKTSTGFTCLNSMFRIILFDLEFEGGGVKAHSS